MLFLCIQSDSVCSLSKKPRLKSNYSLELVRSSQMRSKLDDAGGVHKVRTPIVWPLRFFSAAIRVDKLNTPFDGSSTAIHAVRVTVRMDPSKPGCIPLLNTCIPPKAIKRCELD